MTDIVKHRIFGVGDVVDKEVKENSTSIKVIFRRTGKEMCFAIPQSFETGIIEAEGRLKDEVDAAIALRKEREAERINCVCAAQAASSSNSISKKQRNRVDKKTAPTNVIATTYEDYLIKSGYSIESGSGNPSTVYSYIRAVEAVMENEGISWATLKNNISDIVKKYDVGGSEEAFGMKSNKTFINALKRFEEFVNS